MDIVALTRLATSAEAEATLLARDLAVTPFEARQRLTSLPCVVLMTTERARTAALVAALRGRGHGVVAVDSASVTPASAMLVARRFRFTDEAWITDEGPGAPAEEDARVTFAGMIAFVRASHRREIETREETKEKKFRPGAALATGGLVLTKTVTREVVRTTEDREPVLYVFRRGAPPCLLREGAAQYGGLGALLRPTRIENFATAVRALRERAPSVPYDERLVGVKRFPAPPSTPGAARSFDPETGGVDLLAHLLAMGLAGGGTG